MGDLKKLRGDRSGKDFKASDYIIEYHEKREADTIQRLREYINIFYLETLEKEKQKEREKKMARYRTYKNGITGHRYKGLYIIRGNQKGEFAIWREDKSVFQDKIYDYEECEWIIDKATADPETISIIKLLYEKEIFELSGLMIELIQKKDREGGLEQKSQDLYNWVEKVRRRKAEDRSF